MSDHVLIYVTTSTEEEARRIGGALVEEGLAACVNVLPGMTSIYRWEGRVSEDSECVLLAKTQDRLVDKTTKVIKELHSYSCPCVVALPVVGGNSDFLNWITEETGRTDPRQKL